MNQPTEAIHIQPRQDGFGAVVTGLDLSQTLEASAVAIAADAAKPTVPNNRNASRACTRITAIDR